ncbi:MAG: glutamate racemase [Oscillospiraceae bacterium]|nr:glutamate racemase [Oscillospiraceae bacterium]
MDKRPIGVFDSGLGGLTAVRQLMEQLPGEDIIFFGDTSRVPYGTRSQETILKYSRQDINFLMQFDIKAIVIACNTADTAAGAVVQREYDLPICGALRPAAAVAARTTKNNRIGVIGTTATIRAGGYEAIIRELRPEAQVKSVACPLLVPLVENHRYQRGDRAVEIITGEYLEPLKDWGCDTLVLGCTHYPLLWDVISAYMGPGVTLINSGREAARALAMTLREADLLSGRDGGGTCRYYVSDAPEGFVEMASLFLQRPVEHQVEQIDIERY